METYHLLPGSFTIRRAGLDLTLSRIVKVQVVGKSELGGSISPLLIPQDSPRELPVPWQLQGTAPLNGADWFSHTFNRAYENQVAAPAEGGSK